MTTVLLNAVLQNALDKEGQLEGVTIFTQAYLTNVDSTFLL